MRVVYKHAVVAAFRIYVQRSEDGAKRGGWRRCINIYIYILLIMENHGKIMELQCVFEFLWEPCLVLFLSL